MRCVQWLCGTVLVRSRPDDADHVFYFNQGRQADPGEVDRPDSIYIVKITLELSGVFCKFTSHRLSAVLMHDPEFQRPEDDLCAPCACRGTQRFVHVACLKRFIQTRTVFFARDALICPCCRSLFRVDVSLRPQCSLSLVGNILFTITWKLGYVGTT